jgi:hypothetical protein
LELCPDPAEHGLHNAFLTEDIYALAGGHQGVGAAVFAQVQVALFGDVIHEIGNLIGMSFDDNFVFGLRINYAHYRAVSVHEILVDVRFDIFQPQFLTFFFEASGRGIVEVGFEKLERFGAHDYVVVVLGLRRTCSRLHRGD